MLHVLEDPDRKPPETELAPSWRKQSDPRGIARKQLCADIAAAGGRATMLVAEGDPAEEILRVGDAERCQMIVIGLGREGAFGRFGLGKTMDRLLRRSRLPVLVVRDRPPGPYRHILAATDFSASSRHAIELAARLFPGADAGVVSRLWRSHLCDYAVDMDVDLVVFGASGRSAFVEALVGCAATSIIHEVPCDAPLVGEPRTHAD